MRTGRLSYHTKAYRPSHTAPVHIGWSYEKKAHEHPKEASIEEREEDEFTKGPRLTRDSKRSDIGLDHENTLPEKPEEGATEQNEPFLLRSPKIQDKLGPGKEK